MSIYKQKLNPRTGQFNLVSSATVATFKESVATYADLPLVGNSEGDARLTNDTGHLYIWDGLTWQDQGDFIDLEWSAINGKPSSSPAEIDDAVSKKHTPGIDPVLARPEEANYNPIYPLNDPLVSAQRAILYFPAGFNVGGLGTFYKYVMVWANDNFNILKVSGSNDFKTWTYIADCVGLPAGSHPCLVQLSSTSFRLYYIIANITYNVTDLHVADSNDLLNFSSDQPLQNDLINPIVTGAGVGWNRGSYGMCDVKYNDSATNIGSDPRNYSYMSYFDATDGAFESIALGYSVDGITFALYGSSPILDHSTETWGDNLIWDSAYTTGAQVIKISDSKYLMFYCGGMQSILEGIGTAISTDGLSWTKLSVNLPTIAPLFGSWRHTAVSFPSIVVDFTTRFAGAGELADVKMITTGGDAALWAYSNGVYIIPKLVIPEEETSYHLEQYKVPQQSASLVKNDSSVSGATVKDALNTLRGVSHTQNTDITLQADIFTYGADLTDPGSGTLVADFVYSSQGGSENSANTAFDDIFSNGTDAYAWESAGINGNINQYVGVQFSSGQLVKKLRVRNGAGFSPNRGAQHCKLEGSNNGTDWTKISATSADSPAALYNIDEFVLSNDNDTIWQSIYFIENNTSYLYYRIYVYNNYGDSDYIAIKEIELLSATAIPAALIQNGELKSDLAVSAGVKIGGNTIEDMTSAITDKHTQNTDTTIKGIIDVVDQHSEADGLGDGTYEYRAQSFIPSRNGLVTKVSFKFDATQLPFSGDITFELRTEASGGIPSATILASKTIHYEIDDYLSVEREAIFDTPVDVTSGTTYFIDYYTSAPSVILGHFNSGSGGYFSHDGAAWLGGSVTWYFKVYLQDVGDMINNGTLINDLKVVAGKKIGNSSIEDIDFVTQQKHRAPLLGQFAPSDLSSAGILTITHNWDLSLYALLTGFYVGTSSDTFAVTPVSIECKRNSVLVDLSTVTPGWTYGYYIIQGEHQTIP
jgi:hypothetical protein